MNPEEKPQTNPTPEPPVETGPIIHTYEDDLSRAMNATEASVVQELLATAREKETEEKEENVRQKQKGWYVIGSLLLIMIAVAAAGYGIFHYFSLTVPVSRTLSVGVFPSTEAVVANETTIAKTTADLGTKILPEKKPYLIPIVTDARTLTLLNNNQLFNFIEADPTEPLETSMDTVRLGAVDMGDTIKPFIIASTHDPERTSKEFLIAEGDLLELFHKALAVDLTTHQSEIGKTFTGEYLYNLPVRTLKYIDGGDGKEKVLILYGYATENIVVITTDPEVLKAVYDTIIQQQ